MALTTRLLLFFLSLLALVLLCFSTTLYLFAHNYLYQSVDDRLQLVLSAVSSGIESSSSGLEWEPNSRQLQIDSSKAEAPMAWVVEDEGGRIVERSSGLGADAFASTVANLPASGSATSFRIAMNDELWLAARRYIGANEQGESEERQSQDTPDEVRFSALTVTVGISLMPVKSLLRQLALTLIVLSVCVWFAGLLSGNWICRQALKPVYRMARVASEIDANNLAKRLPEMSTGDAIEVLSRSFNLLLDRLQDSFERQRRFTGEASHQLRSPLTVLLGQIEVATSRERSVEEYQRVLAILQENSEHLASVVDSLLFLARADSEATKPPFEQIDLATWISDYLQSWSTHPRADQIVLQTNAIHHCEIESHPVLLAELLNILLDNACKYSAPQTLITITLASDDTTANVSVIDHGCGFDVHHQDELFTPFRRAEYARLRGIPGVGLGLAIAKRLATVLDCEISVTSKINEGSQFHLRFRQSGSSVTS